MKGKFITLLVMIVAGVGMVVCAGCRKLADLKGTAPAELQQVRRVISLAGQWFFKLDPNNVGEEKKWYTAKLTDYIKLPGSTTENGYGNDISVDTKWTGSIVDRSWFTDAKYEKYRQGPRKAATQPGSVKIPFWLTPVKHYVGPAWYQKQVHIPESWRGKRIVLFLERCHWETKVWIDGIAVGSQDSLCTPHLYDVSNVMTAGKHLLTIRVDNSIKYNVGVNAHSVSDHTQTNWNGIIGRIELQATDRVWVGDVQVYPDIENKRAKLRITIGNATSQAAVGMLTISAESYNTPQRHRAEPETVGFNASKPQSTVELDYMMGEDVLLWDEFCPTMYKLTVLLKGATKDKTFHDRHTITFGMRRFSTTGTQFTINDRLTFLRGTLECCIFPLTGYPDMTVEGWLRIFRIAKAHGLNH
ncbi:MAG: sugar-binding domain-containing protein, partial [Sedimentisphaerales bacterium]